MEEFLEYSKKHCLLNKKRKVIIDTDPGIDDVEAIIMALTCPDIEIVAFTGVQGNVLASQAGKNLCKLMNYLGRNDIPIYIGSDINFVGVSTKGSIYGKDGMGESKDLDDASVINSIKQEHAVTFLVDYVQKNKGEVTLIALGPLTNVAMAYMLDDQFFKNLCQFYIMGGSLGKGNITPHAEFNYWCDAFAALQVMEMTKNSKLIISDWNLTLNSLIPKDYISSKPSIYGKALELLENTPFGFSPERMCGDKLFTADPLCMAIVLYPEIVKKVGKFTCKDVSIEKDFLGKTTFEESEDGNIFIPTEVDTGAFFKIMGKMTE